MSRRPLLFVYRLKCYVPSLPNPYSPTSKANLRGCGHGVAAYGTTLQPEAVKISFRAR